MLPDVAWDGLVAASYVDAEGLKELDPSCREEAHPFARRECEIHRRDERAEAIAHHPDLKDHDVIVLQEAFSDSDRGRIIRGLFAMGYRYHSRILGSDKGLSFDLKNAFEQDGGVIVASRWPIQCVAQRLFGDVCSGLDCKADKGVLHAIINKEGQRYNIFATHLNNGDSDVLRRQLQIMKAFIDEMHIPSTEPVIIAGDFNINFNKNDRNNPLYAEMLRILNAYHPPQADGQYPEKTVVGSSYLDYVLYSKGHFRPAAASNSVLMPRDEKGDLSDHYAVMGRLTLRLITFAPDGRVGLEPAGVPTRCVAACAGGR